MCSDGQCCIARCSVCQAGRAAGQGRPQHCVGADAAEQPGWPLWRGGQDRSQTACQGSIPVQASLCSTMASRALSRTPCSLTTHMCGAPGPGRSISVQPWRAQCRALQCSWGACGGGGAANAEAEGRRWRHRGRRRRRQAPVRRTRQRQRAWRGVLRPWRPAQGALLPRRAPFAGRAIHLFAVSLCCERANTAEVGSGGRISKGPALSSQLRRA